MTRPDPFANPSFRRSITEKESYIEILDTNKELRKELDDEITENNLKDKKLKALSRELETCYRTLSHQDSTILAHEDEIASLKSEIKSLKQRLHKALQDLRYKADASTAQVIHILRLEDKVDQLKTRIYEITGLSHKKVSNNKEILDMEHTIQGILDRRFEASASLARIQIHLDNAGIILPDDIRGQFDRVGTCLANIITYICLVQRYC
jgi:chromosome segregation ATPase